MLCRDTLFSFWSARNVTTIIIPQHRSGFINIREGDEV
jgi:hypothetical protein